MRVFLLFTFCLIFSTFLKANSTYTFGESFLERVSIGDSVGFFFEEANRHTIEEVMLFPDTKFTQLQPERSKQKMGNETTVWAKIQVVNPNSRTENCYFNFCGFADSVWVYTVTDNELIDEKTTGSAIAPPNKSIPSLHSYIPFSIKKEEKTTYYFKLFFISPVNREHIKHIYIYPSDYLIHAKIGKYAWNSFYAGIMILFSLVSLFMLSVFRENTFIYFALLSFSFAAYFLNDNEVAHVFIMHRVPISHYAISIGIVSLMMISAFLFNMDYIHLKRHFPRFYRYYLIYTIFAVIFGYVLYFFSTDYPLSVYFHNFIIFIWIVIQVIPIAILAYKKDKSARILLASIGLLLFTALLFLLGLLYFDDNIKIFQYVFQIGTIVFSSILFYGLFDKVNTIRREKRRFEELDQMKSRFFANISHEFRTPLTLVMGPIQELVKKQKNGDDKRLLKAAYNNAQRLLQLINQLLDLSKLEAGKMELHASKQDFVALLKGIVMSFESFATRKNIRLHFVSEVSEIELYVDRDKIEKIFYNLLSNALKFTNEQGEVAVLLSEKKNRVEIQVQDNGIGIAASRLPFIFNRFFQVDSSEIREHEGTGIGLALVKELVELHKGTIEVKSELKIGSTFTLSLSKGKNHLKEEQISKIEPMAEESAFSVGVTESFLLQEEQNPSLSPELLAKYKKLPTVLVIEDHADVRAYIKQYLIQSFHILEAINGEDGIEKAFEHLPDLVISDVMMPKKNGYEVCQTLKTDQRTSHIPIILLTAKAAQEEKLQGLETGADDYLVKPFDTRELEIRVRNLIEVRRQLRKSFAEAPKIEPEAIQTNSIDQAFLEKVCGIVEKHLSDEQFGVEILVKEVGMSRSHLNRKLKALTDQSANKLIRSIRLEKAAEMLRQKTGNISEIAFETGFSSTSYFVKCFRDKYGTTPGNYLTD